MSRQISDRSPLRGSALQETLIWVAAALAAAMLVRTLSSSPMMKTMRGKRTGKLEGPRPPGNRPFETLRGAVWGRSRREVANLLGSPPAAGDAARAQAVGAAEAVHGDPSMWIADIWYYPLNPAQRTAVAIRFINDRALRIDFISGISRND